MIECFLYFVSCSLLLMRLLHWTANRTTNAEMPPILSFFLVEGQQQQQQNRWMNDEELRNYSANCYNVAGDCVLKVTMDLRTCTHNMQITYNWFWIWEWSHDNEKKKKKTRCGGRRGSNVQFSSWIGSRNATLASWPWFLRDRQIDR